MKSPFSEFRDLILAFWHDPVFIWLVSAVFASGAWFWLFTGVSWHVVCGLVALGCLAAMLEVTWGSNRNR
jgi:hypothetical protein